MANCNSCCDSSFAFFGRGKISSLMGDVAKGIKSFKKGMSDDTSSNNENNKTNSDNPDSENK